MMQGYYEEFTNPNLGVPPLYKYYFHGQAGCSTKALILKHFGLNWPCLAIRKLTKENFGQNFPKILKVAGIYFGNRHQLQGSLKVLDMTLSFSQIQDE